MQSSRSRGRIFRNAAVSSLALVFLTGNVPWVDGHFQPKFEGRVPLTEKQQADDAYRKGRFYYLEGKELEAKARAAKSDATAERYLKTARARYRASADTFALSLRRSAAEDQTPDYLTTLYLEMADSLFKSQQFDQANDAYKLALAAAPAFLHARFGQARVRLARADLDGVKNSYTTLLTEADTRAEAWEYVDELMRMIGSWLESDAVESLPAEQTESFRQWFETQQAELAETIRWTVLDAQSN